MLELREGGVLFLGIVDLGKATSQGQASPSGGKESRVGTKKPRGNW